MAVRTSMVMEWMQREGKKPIELPDLTWSWHWKPSFSDDPDELPIPLHDAVCSISRSRRRANFTSDLDAIAALEAALDATNGWNREPGTIHGRTT
jgi:hypothetical protein